MRKSPHVVFNTNVVTSNDLYVIETIIFPVFVVIPPFPFFLQKLILTAYHIFFDCSLYYRHRHRPYHHHHHLRRSPSLSMLQTFNSKYK